MRPKRATQSSRWLNLAIAVLPVVGVIILGQCATFPNLVPWYMALQKPVFNPPNWIFAPAWTTLYALMAFAVWRILSNRPSKGGKTFALVLFFSQLGLNALWSWLFFALHNPGAGLLDIIPQLLIILATIGCFYRLDRLAGLCLTPLALWVAFATLLNFEIWRLNG